MTAGSRERYRLDGKVALVTGGASGIGEATCRELVSAGAQVWIADLNYQAAEELGRAVGNAKPLQMNVADAKSVSDGFGQLKSLDILVNNAGIGLVGDVLHTSEEDFVRVMNVNVTSVFLVTKAALPLLLESHGSIVNLGSVAGLVGVKQRFAYCASKGAVIAMTRQLAVDYPKELRVNCIAPGTVQTPFVEGYLDKYHAHEKDKVRGELVARQPIGRLGTPEDVAEAVAFLASEPSAYITGQVLNVDGGMVMA